MWLVCDGCHQVVYEKHHARALGVCPCCGRHSRLGAADRIRHLLDQGPVRPVTVAQTVNDPLEFTDSKPYVERLRQARQHTGLQDCVMCVHGTIGGYPVVAAVMDFRFLSGSMGCAAGEHISAAAAAALRERVPPVMLIGHQKGHTVQELRARNFGMDAVARYMATRPGVQEVERKLKPYLSAPRNTGSTEGFVQTFKDNTLRCITQLSLPR